MVNAQPARPSHFANGGSGKREQQNNADRKTKNTHQWRRIENADPMEFPDFQKTALMSTSDLAIDINKFFSKVFDDWHGCLVTFTPQQTPMVTFYFKPMNKPTGGDNDHRAFVPIGDPKGTGNSSRDKIVAINQQSMRKDNFQMTDYASELLYDLLEGPIARNIDPFNPQSYRARQIIAETASNQNPMYPGMQAATAYCLLTCIDLNKVLCKIYGSKSIEDNSQNLFLVTPLRPKNLMPGQAVDNRTEWLISVIKMTRNQFEKAMKVTGALQLGDIPAITARG